MGSAHQQGTAYREGGPPARVAWRRHLPPGMRPEDVRLAAAETLPRAWRAVWERDPEAVAVLDPGGAALLTRRDLERRSARVAAALHHRGVRPGDRVLISAANSPELILAVVGVLRLGAVVVPANPAYRRGELTHIVRTAEPVAAVVDDEERAAWAAEAGGVGLITVSPAAAAAIDGEEPRAVTLDSSSGSDLAAIVFTSGTTGPGKGAMLTHGNLLAGLEAVRLAWRVGEGDGLVLALPLFHVHGLCLGVLGSLLAGARVLLLPRFDAAGVVAACARRDATLFFGVPTMYARLVRVAGDVPGTADALASLRLLVSGSAPLPASLWEAVRDLCGQRVIERYGMTETLITVSNPVDGPRRPGTIGLPLPGVECRIVTGSGEDASDGQDGELLVRGPSVGPGYWRDPEATAAVLDRDGWLRTGDVARRDADGWLSIVGRIKEVVLSGGYTIHPGEVEEVLAEHPGVDQVAVTGRPSEEWGEEVAAWIVPADMAHPPSAEELDAWCRERLAAHKRPRAYAVVEALPRNAMGKVVRTRLR